MSRLGSPWRQRIISMHTFPTLSHNSGVLGSRRWPTFFRKRGLSQGIFPHHCFTGIGALFGGIIDLSASFSYGQGLLGSRPAPALSCSMWNLADCACGRRREIYYENKEIGSVSYYARLSWRLVAIADEQNGSEIICISMVKLSRKFNWISLFGGITWIKL